MEHSGLSDMRDRVLNGFSLRKFIISSFAWSTAAVLAACSASPKYELEPGGMKLSVKADAGVAISPEQRLIHFVELPHSKVDSPWTLPQGEVLTDIHGEVRGVLLHEVDESSPFHDVGLLAEDVVTAIDRHHVQSLEELSMLRDSVAATGRVTMTIERGHVPHRFVITSGVGKAS